MAHFLPRMQALKAVQGISRMFRDPEAAAQGALERGLMASSSVANLCDNRSNQEAAQQFASCSTDAAQMR